MSSPGRAYRDMEEGRGLLSSGREDDNNRSTTPPPLTGRGQGQGQTQRVKDTQRHIDEVVGIMKINVEKVIERDSKLDDLSHRTDKLQIGAEQFQTQATALRRKYWWENMKMMTILGITGLIVLCIILYSIFSN